MSTKKRRHRTGFLENYRLDETYLLKPDRAKGRPGIYGGFSPDGNPILVKVWPRASEANDHDLEDIWRHELRQLHRLAGYPGAADCIAHLHDAGYDSNGFYLILAPGQRRPLSSLLAAVGPGNWIRQPRQPASRARIWGNLKLLARGLETLHSQGLLHRNIDAWAVLTAGGEEPDFQLTGFEWSMRIVGGETTQRRSTRGQNAQALDSFLSDWLMYGMLAGELLGANADRLLNLKLASYEVAEHLSAEESRLLRNIVQVHPVFPLNGEVVVQRIDDILRLLASNIARREPKLHIALRLGSGTALAERIRLSTENDIEVDDTEAQLTFVVDDLAEAPMLLALKPRDGGEGMRLVLRGKNLSYQLQEYRQPRSTNSTWEFAYCESVERTPPAPINIIGQKILEPTAIELMTTAVAFQRFPRLRGKLTSWEDWRRKFLVEAAPLGPEQITHKALSLIQFLEAIYAAADVFPVEILPQESGTAESPDGDVTLRVRSRPDPERDNLSKALNLNAPEFRLAQALIGDGVRPEGWILTDSRSLGERNPSNTEWRFQEVEHAPRKPDSFIFKGTAPTPVLQDAFLIPEGSLGRDVQFRRRLKALKALKDHLELLRMISDPRQRIIESHDPLTEDDAFAKLDGPKQQALRELTATLPLYLIQGPPGVGKTRLVRDLVRRRFADEPTSRLLLTAQSNAAIDHLMDELEALLDVDAQGGPLVVRCSAKDSFEVPGRFDIREQSQLLIKRLATSNLVSQQPLRLRAALATLAAATSAPGDMDDLEQRADIATVSGRAIAQAFRAFEGVVVRAANVVFATTNSGELERLIDERGQFDWAIVEEAAKATGSELVSPLLLSHRRLMIGDHKQLPPFASDQLIALLEVPEKVIGALKIGEEFVGRSLRDATTEEVLDEIEEDESELPALCTEALRVLTFFENAIEAEFQRQSRRRAGRPIAKKLTAQHRMHPDIASLVSRCFYQGELTTHPDCTLRYKNEQRPLSTSDVSRLPLTPIVVIDMPYVQSTVGQQKGDRYPRWHNPLEVEAVIEAMSLLGANPIGGKAPTLAVLSPYNQQVRRLDLSIRDAKAKRLANLKGFGTPSHTGTLCHTVDSFQGSEADLVIVSLVRNNGHSNVQSALGFLTDDRRMNVLLSRARWQLVLVASLDFLSEVVASAKGGADEQRILFIAEMLKELSEGQLRGAVSKIPFRQLTKVPK